METISESYFGVELTPVEIIHSSYGVIYVCVDHSNDLALYNESGESAMSLSTIDVKEFMEVFEKNLTSIVSQD